MTRVACVSAEMFGVRLSGQASVCKFVMTCPGCTTYTEEILRVVFTRGIADAESQLDLLGDKNQDMKLEVFQFVEAKEAGKRSTSRLLDSHAAETARKPNTVFKDKEELFHIVANMVMEKNPQLVCVKPNVQRTVINAYTAIRSTAWRKYVAVRVNLRAWSTLTLRLIYG